MVLAHDWWPAAKVLLLLSNYEQEDRELVGCDGFLSSEPSSLIHEIGMMMKGIPACAQ